MFALIYKNIIAQFMKVLKIIIKCFTKSPSCLLHQIIYQILLFLSLYDDLKPQL